MPTMERSTRFAAIAGAITSLVVWTAKTFADTPISPEIAATITTIVMALITHLVPDVGTGAPPDMNKGLGVGRAN